MCGRALRNIGCWKYNGSFVRSVLALAKVEKTAPLQTPENVRMRSKLLLLCLLCTALVLPGCATGHRRVHDETPSVQQVLTLSHEVEEKIFALDPTHVTETDIRETLAK